MMVRDHFSEIAPIFGRFPVSLFPPHPKTVMTFPPSWSAISLASVRIFSSASGVWAKSTMTV